MLIHLFPKKNKSSIIHSQDYVHTFLFPFQPQPVVTPPFKYVSNLAIPTTIFHPKTITWQSPVARYEKKSQRGSRKIV